MPHFTPESRPGGTARFIASISREILSDGEAVERKVTVQAWQGNDQRAARVLSQEREQFAEDEHNILVVNCDPQNQDRWAEDLTARLQPSLNTRVGAVILFSWMGMPAGTVVKTRSVRHPHARRPISDGIVESIERGITRVLENPRSLPNA